MQARFKQFTKRQNSTKRPSGLQLYNVTLKGPCSILKPRLEIKWNGTGDPTLYNMVYISTFGRYYWITNWTYEDRCWVCDCKVDVLASYKTEIGNASKYILRSASSYDTKVIDTKYPAKAGAACHQNTFAGPSWATTYAGGRFVVGITGQGNTFNAGGIGYIVVDTAGLFSILNAAYTGAGSLWPTSTGSTIGEALAGFGDNLQKSLAQPFQYINSVIWVPFVPTTSGTTTVSLGYINTGISAATLSDPVHLDQWSETYSSAWNGTDAWPNMAPFVRYILEYPPFGTTELDTSLMYGGDTLTYTCRTDVTTGVAYMQVTANSSGTAPYPTVWTASTMLGIQIPIGGIQTNYAAALSAGAQALGGIIGAVMTPSAGSITGAISGIGNAIEAAQPGSVGGGRISTGLAALNSVKRLKTIVYTPVDQDNTEQGRPLCKVDTISNYSGYLLLADGDVAISGTPEEMAEINSYLTGGFFYE